MQNKNGMQKQSDGEKLFHFLVVIKQDNCEQCKNVRIRFKKRLFLKPLDLENATAESVAKGCGV